MFGTAVRWGTIAKCVPKLQYQSLTYPTPYVIGHMVTSSEDQNVQALPLVHHYKVEPRELQPLRERRVPMKRPI